MCIERSNSSWNALTDAFNHFFGLTDPTFRYKREQAKAKMREDEPCKLCGDLIHTTFGYSV